MVTPSISVITHSFCLHTCHVENIGIGKCLLQASHLFLWNTTISNIRFNFWWHLKFISVSNVT
ncbi:unnamed protein product [Schistosoma mattheei]|uniref:Uncharacterized protein n=1 Tax=Schistosoma mattheei TaxID=31246 RepID=A0A3P8BWV2_9TREM|nr:unnamed protein product [Schistosoma mattheei]